jgi:hypothetical protein
LVDGSSNPPWNPGVTNGNVVFNLNSGADVTFEMCGILGDGTPDDATNEIDSFALDTGPSSTGPWTEVLTDGGNTYDRSASWMFFQLSSPQTAKYIRWRYLSTHGGDPEVGEVRISNIIDQEETDPPDPPPDPPPSASFPATAVLDTFTRANGAIGGNWIDGLSGTGTCLISGNASVLGTGVHDCYYNTQYGPDVEVYATLPLGASHAATTRLWLFACVQSAGIGTTGWDGYAIRVRKDAGIDDLIEVQRIDNDVKTSLGASTTVEHNNGFKFGMRIQSDGSIKGYANSGSGWILLLERSDATYGCTNSYLAMEHTDASQAIDDFGGGTVAPGESTTDFVPSVIFMD